jgi:hemoglobin
VQGGGAILRLVLLQEPPGQADAREQIGISEDNVMTIQITEDDIAKLVSAFYTRIRDDAVLGPIFNGAIDDWPNHLDKLEAFWSSVLLTTGRYKGQPMIAHVRHEGHMTAENFARWLTLWRQTSTEVLAPEAAAVFQLKAERIAESLQLGVQFYRDRNTA